MLGAGLLVVVAAAALARVYSGRQFLRVVAVMGVGESFGVLNARPGGPPAGLWRVLSPAPSALLVVAGGGVPADPLLRDGAPRRDRRK